MESLNLYAMVDKSGHVCRDEDGKVVYDREDHHALDVRLFNMHRPESKPHTVVRFVTHADYKALEAKCESLEYHGRKMAEKIGSLTTELAECRKDAERYAHIRDRAQVEGHDGGWSSSWRLPCFDRHNDSPNKDYKLQRQSLDEAVDNAIARSKA